MRNQKILKHQRLYFLVKALGDPNRTKILAILNLHRYLNITQIQIYAKLERQAAQYHLKILREAKLVKYKRVMNEFAKMDKLYSLNILRAIELLDETKQIILNADYEEF